MTAKRKKAYKIVVYPDWCKGCGICAAFCPKKVLAIDHQGKAVVKHEENCINCGFCELHCPDFAIVVLPVDGDGPSQAARPDDPDPPAPSPAPENPAKPQAT